MFGPRHRRLALRESCDRLALESDWLAELKRANAEADEGEGPVDDY